MSGSVYNVRAYLTGETLEPGVSHTRRLFIPGDGQMLANVCGALLDLTYETSWEEFGAVTPADAADAALTMYNRFLVETWSMIGALIPAITASTPPGCLELDGSTYDGDDYPDLYAVLHSEWLNGDGTFTVPDLRGKFPLATSASHAMGQTGGAETVTLTTDQMPSHIHTTGNSISGVAVSPGELPVLCPNPLPAYTGSAGGDGSHNNMPPFLAVRYVLIAQ